MDGDSTAPGLTTVSLIVNGRAVALAVEPRTHLADALRERLNLTGTHLGCEQGVCGACTVLLDGKPQRSCIAYAVDCDGSEITTIEGFDNDATMTTLRQAFSEHHALQCGFCTPGMLITARDIVLRLGEVSTRRIREELSGNLCRCTGYVGIVAAVSAAAAGRTPQMTPVQRPIAVRHEEPPPAAAPVTPDTVLPRRVSAGGPVVEERLKLARAPDAVWAALSDLQRVAACLPGAELEILAGGPDHRPHAHSSGPGEGELLRHRHRLPGCIAARGPDQRPRSRLRDRLRNGRRGELAGAACVRSRQRACGEGHMATDGCVGPVRPDRACAGSGAAAGSGVRAQPGRNGSRRHASSCRTTIGIAGGALALDQGTPAGPIVLGRQND